MSPGPPRLPQGTQRVVNATIALTVIPPSRSEKTPSSTGTCQELFHIGTEHSAGCKPYRRSRVGAGGRPLQGRSADRRTRLSESEPALVGSNGAQKPRSHTRCDVRIPLSTAEGGRHQNASASSAIIEALPLLIARNAAVACGRMRSKKKRAVVSLAL